MAAIDPSAAPKHTGTVNGNTPSRATLKLVYDPQGPGDEDDSKGDSEDEEEVLKAIMEARGSQEDDEDDEEDLEDEESSSDDEEKNGGPSDPSKTKKARREAAMKQMMDALADSKDESEDDVEMGDAPKTNGVVGKSASKSAKGKGKALAEDSDDEESSAISQDGMDEQVICTLDPEKTYQQPLDITIPEDQPAYFKVSGTHAVYLTGNYVIPPDDDRNHQHDEDSDDYDMSPDEEELGLMEDDESDELDDIEDPRITEVGTDDEEEAPKLVKKEKPTPKGKNKRAHEESSDIETPAASLDDIMAKSLKPAEPSTNGVTGAEPKLSKKQMKKLKNNAGKAVEAAVENKDVKKDNSASKDTDGQKGDKKVQFAKNLEQGPSSSPAKESKDKTDTKKDDGKPKATLGVKTIAGGVKIDDKKLGTGPVAKKGSKVGMRYIGKLKDGKVFDANKKGKPFSFTLGDGSVIKGWDIGVAGMSVGSERRITVPAEMAYGKKGAPPDIPPNSELIFDLKMLEVK
ncbi:peptidylprolyl isomerase fpr3 [Lecanora helva]